jgi:outer membrane protein assembly factor BamD
MVKDQLKLFAGTSVFLIIVLSSCKSEYEKLRTSNDNAKKYSEAVKLYNNQEYKKALGLFEPIVRRYTPQEQVEDLYYYYAYTIYKLKDYTLARYQFKNFADTYSLSPKAEECRFMAAYCYYLDSPIFSLDQGNTVKAIESLQYFINLYPNSDRVADAGKLIQNLRSKLEEKSYANSKLYFAIGDWQAAVISPGNTLRDYPDTKYAEELDFLTIRAQYEYAQHSREDHQVERYNQDVGYVRQFIEKYPDSKYLKDAKDYLKYCNEDIAKVKIY